MDKAVNAFFNLNKYAEVGEVAHFCSVLAANGIFGLNIFPRIFFELFDAKAHLAVFAVQCQDNGFDFVANLHEVLS